jgi:hypothetical protein
MKKLLLSLSALVILGLPKVSAQTIPNLDFEEWTTNAYSAGGAPDPNGGVGNSGWWEFNIMSSSLVGSSPITVFEGSSNPAPESGSHYAAIVSDTMTTEAYGYLSTYGFTYPKTNGLMFTGYEDVYLTPSPGVKFKAGIPIAGKLSSFSFYYRYIPNGTDTCSCLITFSHWNTTTNKSYVIGGGKWTSYATTKTWTQNTVNITYDSASIPDTVFIQFSACSLYATGNPKQYDTMDIDGASYTGINNITAQHDNVNLYPNPAKTEVTLAVSGQFQAARVEIYDITGKAIGTYSMNNNLLTINTQAYSSGLYFYKLLDNTGAQLNVGKFSVIK